MEPLDGTGQIRATSPSARSTRGPVDVAARAVDTQQGALDKVQRHKALERRLPRQPTQVGSSTVIVPSSRNGWQIIPDTVGVTVVPDSPALTHAAKGRLSRLPGWSRVRCRVGPPWRAASRLPRHR
jgi:hypothetical protein